MNHMNHTLPDAQTSLICCMWDLGAADGKILYDLVRWCICMICLSLRVLSLPHFVFTGNKSEHVGAVQVNWLERLALDHSRPCFSSSRKSCPRPKEEVTKSMEKWKVTKKMAHHHTSNHMCLCHCQACKVDEKKILMPWTQCIFSQEMLQIWIWLFPWVSSPRNAIFGRFLRESVLKSTSGSSQCRDS